MGYTVYRLERKIASTGYWYETMLSPFLRVNDAGKHIKEYEKYYPKDEAVFRVLDQKVTASEYHTIKRRFDRMSNARTSRRV